MQRATTQVRTYRDLIAWQKGTELAKTIYTYTEQLPAAEKYGLTSQIRRAAVSIPSNIAEGYARQTSPDYLKHLRIARGSLAELQTQLLLALELNFLDFNRTVEDLVTETDRVLQGLIQSIARKVQD